jgi:cytidylate kinase
VPQVRALLVQRQRELIGGGGIVVEGRDIGSVVAPDADLKVFLVADSQARAVRRAAEQGGSDSTATHADLLRRDELDSSRAASPLQQAPDAIVVDGTGMTLDEVVAHVCELASARRNG